MSCWYWLVLGSSTLKTWKHLSSWGQQKTNGPPNRINDFLYARKASPSELYGFTRPMTWHEAWKKIAVSFQRDPYFMAYDILSPLVPAPLVLFTAQVRIQRNGVTMIFLVTWFKLVWRSLFATLGWILIVGTWIPSLPDFPLSHDWSFPIWDNRFQSVSVVPVCCFFCASSVWFPLPAQRARKQTWSIRISHMRIVAQKWSTWRIIPVSK